MEEAVVADFGVAKALSDAQPDDVNEPSYTLSTGAQDTMRWMAPELNDGSCDPPADVYSWAMTVLQVRLPCRPSAQHINVRREGHFGLPSLPSYQAAWPCRH